MHSGKRPAISHPPSCLKLTQERAIYLDFAINAFGRIVAGLKKDRMRKGLKMIKNQSSHFNFENSSKKIFFKIGLATLMLTIQKYDYRSVKWSLKKMRSLKKENLRKSREKISDIFKKFLQKRY